MVDLNLCCGTILLPGVINVDIRPPYDVQADVTRHIPFDDSEVGSITCYHAIEHFNYPMGVHSFLKEVVRVMDSSGILTITTPDAPRILKLMEASGKDVARVRELRNLIFGTRECDCQQHLWLYTDRSLGELLRFYFKEVRISHNPDDHAGPGLQAVCTKPIKEILG